MIDNNRFILIVPPSIVDNGQMINEITIVKGQSLVLTCSLHAIPLPTIVWTKNDQELLDSDRLNDIFLKSLMILFRISLSDHNLKLHIDHISINDRGRYQCQAENIAGRSEQIFNVQVYGNPRMTNNSLRIIIFLFFLVPPEIQQININLNPYVVLGKNLILSCHGFGVPEINYQWFKDKRDLLESHSYARLIIPIFREKST